MNLADLENYGVVAIIPVLFGVIVYLYRRVDSIQSARIEDAKQSQKEQNETYAKFGSVLDKIYDAVIRRSQ